MVSLVIMSRGCVFNVQ